MTGVDPKLGPSRAAGLLKDQGNAAFKAGQYRQAVEHYTAAMRADPSDPILPCNRSMAHLKLEQWREAARDATKSLDVQPTGNGKAHFRRAMARKGLGDFEAALPDFEAASKLDPNNKSIVVEVEQIKQKIKHNPRTKPSASAAKSSLAEPSLQLPVPSSSTTSAPAGPTEPQGASSSRTQQLRAAITPVSTSRDNSFLKEVSTTRKGKGPAVVQPPTTSDDSGPRPMDVTPTPPSSGGGGFAALKKARQDRQTGKTVFVPSSRPPLPTSAQRTRDGESRVRDFADFERRWKSDESDEGRWNVLQSLDPASLPRIFGEHLEPEVVEEMIRVTASSTDDAPRRLELLGGLPSVPRFELLTMFLDPSVRRDLQTFVSQTASVHRSLASSVAQQWGLAM